MRMITRALLVAAALLPLASQALDAQVTRARTLGIALPGTPGASNAITDVPGVEVGHSTIITGSGVREPGRGPARTGVTAILPRGQQGPDSVFGAWFTLNGNGEMTGTVWLEESGIIESPILITNTHSVGVVRDATIEWLVQKGRAPRFMLPIVAETFDGALNDDLGFHVKREYTFEALDRAATGPVAEGNVGGGTGMICHGFKGGIGTASRRFTIAGAEHTAGVLVQCNYGQRRLLRVDGVPVGQEITDLAPCVASDTAAARFPNARRCAEQPSRDDEAIEDDPLAGMGSIIVIVATDAPLLPHQLKRVAKRASLGIGRMGGLGENSSGDIFLAFSTANREGVAPTGVPIVRMLPNDRLNAVFEATVQATEEAILNALLAAETMTGADDLRVFELPHDRLVEALRKYGRLR